MIITIFSEYVWFFEFKLHLIINDEGGGGDPQLHVYT